MKKSLRLLTGLWLLWDERALYSITATAEWLQALTDADIPVMPLNSLDELLDDPHHAATGFFKVMDHPSEGRIREMDIPTTWSKCSALAPHTNLALSPNWLSNCK